jgi:hypothetical protein
MEINDHDDARLHSDTKERNVTDCHSEAEIVVKQPLQEQPSTHRIDATGAGWVYEYAIVDKSGKHSLADLRSLQDWHLRYALETVPELPKSPVSAASSGSIKYNSTRTNCLPTAFRFLQSSTK